MNKTIIILTQLLLISCQLDPKIPDEIIYVSDGNICSCGSEIFIRLNIAPERDSKVEKYDLQFFKELDSGEFFKSIEKLKKIEVNTFNLRFEKTDTGQIKLERLYNHGTKYEVLIEEIKPETKEWKQIFRLLETAQKQFTEHQVIYKYSKVNPTKSDKNKLIDPEIGHLLLDEALNKMKMR